MGRTYVQAGPATHGHPGFWMTDGLLELWLRLLALNLAEPGPEDDLRNNLLRRIRDQWLMASRGGWNGCVPHGFEEFTADPMGMEIVKKAVEALGAALDKSQDDLSPSVLNLLGWYGAEPFGTVAHWRMKDVAQSFRDLLEGRFDLEKADHVPGYGQPPS